MTTEWLESVATNLLRIEREVRARLRTISRRENTSYKPEDNTVSLSPYEARVLLHGAMPAPIAVTRLREPHARLVAALSVFHDHLIRLNDPFVVTVQPETVLQAAVTLIVELRAWHRVFQWKTACRRAKVKFPLPKDLGQVAVIPLMRLQTVEQSRTSPKPSATALQLSLDLEPSRAVAELIDRRQLQLFTPEENVHGKAA